MDNNIDYELLLYKYMGVVVDECPDISGYISKIDKNGRHRSYNHFSEAEIKELQKIWQENEEKQNFKGYG